MAHVLFFANEDIGGPYYGEKIPEGRRGNEPGAAGCRSPETGQQAV